MTKTAPIISTLQQERATRENIIAFIKKAKTKKYSPKILDVCNNFENTKIKPVLPNDAPQAVVLFAGGGGIEAGMVQAGIRSVIAVEFDPTKPGLTLGYLFLHLFQTSTPCLSIAKCFAITSYSPASSVATELFSILPPF